MQQKNLLCEKAVKSFLEDYNCAQSVLLTMFEYWNGENELIPKIATAFGGGIGRCGSVCGALTGGVMALGIKYGTNEPSLEKHLEAYKKRKNFTNNSNGSMEASYAENSLDITFQTLKSWMRLVKKGF
ncbi:MAG: C-GCAxxG-C-C family protein [Candidatus Bathyarchaeia archaeon]